MTRPRRPSTSAVQSPLETYLREINETALLTADEEKMLAYRIEEGDAAARDRMVRANLRLVVNIARGYTGRETVLKIFGSYHGHHDAVMISTKPALQDAGDARRPVPVASSAGITPATIAETTVVPYNDLDALEAALAAGDITLGNINANALGYGATGGQV